MMESGARDTPDGQTFNTLWQQRHDPETDDGHRRYNPTHRIHYADNRDQHDVDDDVWIGSMRRMHTCVFTGPDSRNRCNGIRT